MGMNINELLQHTPEKVDVVIVMSSCFFYYYFASNPLLRLEFSCMGMQNRFNWVEHKRVREMLDTSLEKIGKYS